MLCRSARATTAVRVLLVAMFALGGALPKAAAAGTLNIDFSNVPPATTFNGEASQTYVGVGAAPDAGTYWNVVGPGGASGLLDSNGTSASIGVGTSFESQYSNAQDPLANALLADRLIASDATSTLTHTVTLSGLASGTYNLYAYAGFYGETFTVGGQSGHASGAGWDNNIPATWQQGLQYALLSGLHVDNTGILTLMVTGSLPSDFQNTVYTAIAGLQLQQTPLPPALPLFATGIALLALLRRRMSQSSA
jgi:hypothetical protein